MYIIYIKENIFLFFLIKKKEYDIIENTLNIYMSINHVV